MLHIARWKIILILFVSTLGVLYALPNALPAQGREWLTQNLPGWMPSSTINLGLDLRGGSHLLYEVDTKSVLNDRLETMVETVRTEMRKGNIGYVVPPMATRNAVSWKLRDPAQDHDAAAKIARGLEQKADVKTDADGTITVTLGDIAIKDINAHIIEQSIEIVRRRIDESGTKEPIIQRQGDNRIVVQLPGVDDPQRIKDLIGKTAKMTFHLVDLDSAGGASPGSQRFKLRERPGETLLVKKASLIRGEMLTDSQPTFDQNGAPAVGFRFNSIGAKRFCDITRENIGKPFAIVLDDEIISAPVIQTEICGGNGIITGHYTLKEAQDQSLLLRAGALPAPLNVVEERSVGPTLGSDSITAGKHAAATAFVLVFLAMAGIYGLFGLFANIALLLNIIFILAILSIFQATLTLPGIAGIILTIGIAVDSNVLVYERIREEIRSGRTPLAAIDTGYDRALGTIVDANLTTLIVALILFSFGHGPIKGFAVSMSIGIITSMFSAIMLTRLMIVTWIKRVRPKTLTL